MDKNEIICPGETIKELLEVYHYTQQDLAEKLNMDLKTVNEILNGKAPITVDTAIKLELIFSIDAVFWNNLEFNYRKELKELKEQELLEQEYSQIKNIYKEMVKRKLVLNTTNKYEMLENFKKFMEVVSIDGLKREYDKVACRKANISFDEISLLVWIQIGLKKAREIKVEEYERKKILSQINEIRKLTLMTNQEKARTELVKICQKCGIIVNFEKSMPKTAIYGIAKWLNPNTAFIQVSDRGKNLATFWFTFMHELGHIVDGRKKICFLDIDEHQIEEDEDNQIIKELEEFKADKFSRNSLIPEKEYKQFVNQVQEHGITNKSIIDFAKKIEIAPSIVAGRIKFDTKKYNDKILNSFTQKVEF